MESQKQVEFSRDVLVYVPCYNCESTIGSVLSGIPAEIQARAEVLIVDNFSSDRTAELALETSKSGRLTAPISIVRTRENLGYAGSQKLAYQLACASPSVRWVMMLHGDGQYDPELLKGYLPLLSSPIGLAYGYRSKSKFGKREETPLSTWFLIKSLSLVESLVTGEWRREWHTGFVMYSTRFLNKVSFREITNTPHIDGHLLFSAGVMGYSIAAVPIYKRYKELNAFEGWARIIYVFSVLKLMFEFRLAKNRLKNSEADNTSGVRYGFDIIA